ncbi:hypothetical protein KUTeg_016460 [Tegillarca granosa]|uniref:2-(3-amino-3-carboxypropyl)histidine synthase subunit 2 n=1 Tax=Tegillarca granosa TaxID=220873 RepID=A0ABQ9EL45_TEGGR|nr:hypothetical protein KUTeg_016460 [Tegillarca granosa]
MAATAFSTPDEIVIERRIDVKTRVTPLEDLDFIYEIERSVAWIRNGNYQKTFSLSCNIIALQFPDELMGDSVAIINRLEKDISGQIFILGDTSYGRSCLSQTRRLPVLYVFGQQIIDITDCVQRIQEAIEDKNSNIVLMYDTVYAHTTDKLSLLLKDTYRNLVASKLCINEDKSVGNKDTDVNTSCDKVQRAKVTKCGRSFVVPDETFLMLYIGGESLTLTNLMMTMNRCPFYTYNPETRCARKETINVNKMLMKRFYMIERAKDAKIIGIVVGTLGVADYLQVIDRLKKLIKTAGKKSYTFVVGKLNVPKLANFMEIDVFVLVACSENTLFDSSEFYKPVITPYEMEMACNTNREWTGDYVSDFRQLLPEEPERETVADVSLITGKMRTLGQDTPVELSSSVMLRNDSLTVGVQQQAETAGEYLSSRSWKGLDQKLDETPVVKAVEGRKGIAATYTHETPSSNK